VLQTVSLYTNYFEREGGELSLDNGEALGTWDQLVEDLGDMGVDVMKGKSIDELSNLLGFIGARPVNWNNFRGTDNLVSAWETNIAKDVQERFQSGGQDMVALRLLWHQLCGVAAIVDKVWTEEKRPDVHGVLLADDVGVGKTAQVMASIAFLQLVYRLEEKGLPRPPIISTAFKLAYAHRLLTTCIEDRPYFMGKGDVPNKPHAIVVPNSLVDQWRRELKTFFKPFSLDIFQLPTSADALKAYFSAPDGVWAQAHHLPIFRVVLIPHSVRVVHQIETASCH